MASAVHNYSKNIEGAVEYFIPTKTEPSRIEFFSLEDLDKLTVKKLEELKIAVEDIKC